VGHAPTGQDNAHLSAESRGGSNWTALSSARVKYGAFAAAAAMLYTCALRSLQKKSGSLVVPEQRGSFADVEGPNCSPASGEYWARVRGQGGCMN
jgi:hypothetical protein